MSMPGIWTTTDDGQWARLLLADLPKLIVITNQGPLGVQVGRNGHIGNVLYQLTPGSSVATEAAQLHVRGIDGRRSGKFKVP